MGITKQQVFDAAWNGLRAQGFVQARTRSGHPAARDWTEGKETTACAVTHAFDAFSAAAVAKALGYESEEQPGSYRRLVSCRDESTSPADMERRLREFAKAEGLTVPGDGDAFQAFMAKVQEPVLNETERAVEYLSGRCITRGVDSTR